MFKWEYCYGCNEFDRKDGKECEYGGEYWNCPYSEGIKEDIEREESGDF